MALVEMEINLQNVFYYYPGHYSSFPPIMFWGTSLNILIIPNDMRIGIIIYIENCIFI